MAVEYVRRRPSVIIHIRDTALKNDVSSIHTDFVVSKTTPTIEANLGYKLFMLFATIDMGGLAVFSL